MKERFRGLAGKVTLLVRVAALFGTLFVISAAANNLDRKTATDAAREVARSDCRQTSGCEDFRVCGLHRVSRHKAVGKIHVTSTKNGLRFECTREGVIKLDHFTGEINYGVSDRKCEQIG